MELNKIKTTHLWARQVLIVCAVLLLVVVQAAAQSTAVFSDDAERAMMESYIAQGWTTYSGTVGSPSQTYVHSGKWSYAFRAGQNAYWAPGYTAPDPQYLHLWFYVPSTFSLASGASTWFAGLWQTSNSTYYLTKLTDKAGELYLLANTTAGTHAITTNTWHSFEMKYQVSGGSVTIWLDGAQDIALTGQTLSAMNSVMLDLNAGTGTIYYDDLTVSNAQSTNPTSGITVRHAYPTNRTAMKVQTYLWGAAATDQMVSSVDGTPFSTITNPGTYQEPILTLTSLSAGSHTLEIQLQSSSGTARATWTEIFNAYGGTPTVSINAYNNVVKGGHKVFPISAWAMNPDNDNLWMNKGTPAAKNMNPPGANAAGWFSGYSDSYSPSQYKSYMEGTNLVSGLKCLSTGTLVIGPYAPRMGGYGSDAANMAAYASALTGEPCVLGWFTYDEASVNGYSPALMQGTMNAAHANDNNHPVIYDDATMPYLNLSWYYPTMVADIYSSDDYPLCYADSFRSTSRQWSDWVHAMDRNETANYGLVPNYQVLELSIWSSTGNHNCTSANVAGTSVSNTTVYNEFWMAYIHNRKGISWYNDSVPPYDAGYSPTCVTPLASTPSSECLPVNSSGVPAITPVMTAVNAIGADTLLADPTGRTISTNRNSVCVASPYTAGQRVDATYREFGGFVWIFAARLTDPICNSGENSAAALSTQITVSGLTGTQTATVYGENRSVSVSNGALTDNFNPWAVHIYQIPVSSTLSPPTSVTAVPH